MRYIVLACDYDGTLASSNIVKQETLAALEKLLASKRKLIIVTGRQLDDLLQVFPRASMADYIVAENGAIIFQPHVNKKIVLGKQPARKFVEALKERGVDPISVGEVIVSTWKPNENKVLDTIRDLGLELHVVFNKGAVMILPSGINKGNGLNAALHDMRISAHNVVGVGDAENDYSFLRLCECSIAVSNALPELKEEVDTVTDKTCGEGVSEVIEKLINDDLASLESRLVRHHIILGRDSSGQSVDVKPYGENVLLVGHSAAGKSMMASGFVERLDEQKRQFCLVDPEGDYGLSEGVVLGSKQSVPSVAEIIHSLRNPGVNAIVYLLGVPVEQRPGFLDRLLPELQDLRLRTGHPQWVVIDEAHLFMPPGYNSNFTALPKNSTGFFLITTEPEQLSSNVLPLIDVLIVMGNSPEKKLRHFARFTGATVPNFKISKMQPDSAIIWRPKSAAFSQFNLVPTTTRHRRHSRQYIEGDLGIDRSFFFRGPENKLKLRAQNLALFAHLAQGVDDDTWLYHLKRGDYSRWFREVIKDKDLAELTSRVEAISDISAQDSRNLIIAYIREHYILPVPTT